jgi:hypothetical protein
MAKAKQKPRTKLDNILERHGNQIWQYVRDNKDSLDSERVCKLIRDGLDAAIADVTATLDEIRGKYDRARAEVKELKGLKLLVEEVRVEELQASYSEGFNDGVDHNNLSYKHPPLPIAFLESETRQMFAASRPITEEQEAMVKAWHEMPRDER